MNEHTPKSKLLYDFLYVIFKRKALIVLLAFVSFSLIIFFTYLVTPTYKATAKIWVESNPEQQLILFRDLATPGQAIRGVNPAYNLVEILTSYETARAIVSSYKLDARLKDRRENPRTLRDKTKKVLARILFSPITLLQYLGVLQKREKDYFADAVEDFLDDAQDVQRHEDSNIISVSIYDRDRKVAQAIANHMADIIIRKSTEFNQENAHGAYEFTKSHLQDVELTLRRSEKELLEFKKQMDIISFNDQMQAKLAQLEELESQHLATSTELAEQSSKLEKIQHVIAQQKNMLKDSPIFSNNPLVKDLISSLNKSEIELAGNLEKYGKSSQNVRTLEAQTSETNNKINQELKAISQNDIAILYSIHPDLPNEFVQLNTNVAALEAKGILLAKKIEATKASAQSLSEKGTELKRITREVETNEKLFATLLDKFSELGVQRTSNMGAYDLKIIDRALIPDNSSPYWPNWFLILPVGVIASLFFSFGTSFFLEYWDESFKSPKEIENRLGLPVLSTVPKIEYQKKKNNF